LRCHDVLILVQLLTKASDTLDAAQTRFGALRRASIHFSGREVLRTQASEATIVEIFGNSPVSLVRAQTCGKPGDDEEVIYQNHHSDKDTKYLHRRNGGGEVCGECRA
jgi:hypothetical protein